MLDKCHLFDIGLPSACLTFNNNEVAWKPIEKGLTNKLYYIFSFSFFLDSLTSFDMNAFINKLAIS